MIKINLLGDDTKIDSTSVLFVGGYFLSLFVFFLTSFFLYRSVANSIDETSTKMKQLETTLAGLQKTTQEVKDLEKKKSLLSSKLAVIARLKKNKLGPVRVLDDLNLSIPERAWITSIREKNGLLRIDGVALDNQTIAMFMTDLARSDYFENIELGETKQAERKNVKVYEFTLQAKVNYSGRILPGENSAGPETRSASRKTGRAGA